MALKFLEGFEQYTTGVQLQSATYSYQLLSYSSSTSGYKWSGAYGTSTDLQANTTIYRTTQTNSKSLNILSSNSLFMAIPANQSIIVGFGYRTTDLLVGEIVNFSNTATFGANAGGLRLVKNESGIVSVGSGYSSGSLTTTFGSSNAGVLSINTWCYIEIKVSFHASAGAVEVKVNGESVISVTNQNTLAGLASISGMNLSNNTSTGAYFDDLYICDTTGTVNNDFLGPISVYTLFPSANGTTNNFSVTGAASNYLAVNSAVPDTATYVSSSNTNDKDLYAMSDLPITPSAVQGVMVKARSQKQDNGPRNQQLLIRTSATEATSSNMTATFGSWVNTQAVFEKQADGTTAWDGAAVNAMEVGHKNT